MSQAVPEIPSDAWRWVLVAIGAILGGSIAAYIGSIALLIRVIRDPDDDKQQDAEARLQANPELVTRIQESEARPERRVPRPEGRTSAGRQGRTGDDG